MILSACSGVRDITNASNDSFMVKSPLQFVVSCRNIRSYTSYTRFFRLATLFQKFGIFRFAERMRRMRSTTRSPAAPRNDRPFLTHQKHSRGERDLKCAKVIESPS